MKTKLLFTLLLTSVLVGAGINVLVTASAYGQALVRLAIPQRGLYSTTIPTVVAEQKGFFKEEGLKVEIFWTSGGAETVRVVTAASTDIGLDTGTESLIAAFEKGAPVKVISASITGSPDIFWYLRADSPYKSLADLKGKSIGFSRPGSSTHMVITLANEQFKLGAKLVPVGSPPDSFTAVMTRQVEAGWSAPPLFLDKVLAGETRIVFRGAELTRLNDVTLRANFAHAGFAEKNLPLVRGWLRAHKRALDYLYDNPKEAAQLLADYNKLSLAIAEEAVKFFPRESMALSPIKGIDFVVNLAIKSGMLKKALSPEDVGKLILKP